MKGVRCRLRMALRKAGLKGKFRTDETRKGELLVMAKMPIQLPFTEFEGKKVRFSLRG